MVILETNQNAKSVVDTNTYITYSVSREGEGEVRSIHGYIFKDEKSVGFLSYDNTRASVQFSLNPDNGLDFSGKKLVFDTFMSDIEELINV